MGTGDGNERECAGPQAGIDMYTSSATPSKNHCAYKQIANHADDGRKITISPSEFAERMASTIFSSAARVFGVRQSRYRWLLRSFSLSRSQYPNSGYGDEWW